MSAHMHDTRSNLYAANLQYEETRALINNNPCAYAQLTSVTAIETRPLDEQMMGSCVLPY
jgi:hypothetical protein